MNLMTQSLEWRPQISFLGRTTFTLNSKNLSKAESLVKLHVGTYSHSLSLHRAHATTHVDSAKYAASMAFRYCTRKAQSTMSAYERSMSAAATRLMRSIHHG